MQFWVRSLLKAGLNAHERARALTAVSDPSDPPMCFADYYGLERSAATTAGAFAAVSEATHGVKTDPLCTTCLNRVL